MGRGKPVEIATRSFSTRTRAIEFFKQMLGRYRPGDRVSDEDGLDLSALLERHDEYAEKVGCGLDYFEVMMTEHGTPCFCVVRKDGSRTDFSYPHCVNQRSPSRKEEVAQAFRRAIQLDVYQLRDDFLTRNRGTDGKVPCAISGDRISRGEGRMYYLPPMTFEAIVASFLAENGMDLDEVPITAAQDEQVSPQIADDRLAEAFRKFHAQVAKLEFVKTGVQ